jgi:hypothetical protein
LGSEIFFDCVQCNLLREFPASRIIIALYIYVLLKLGGIALIVIGSIIQWNINNYGSLLPGHVSSFTLVENSANYCLNSQVSVPGIVLIVVGCVTLFVASIGCLGVIRESHCMVLTVSSQNIFP